MLYQVIRVAISRHTVCEVKACELAQQLPTVTVESSALEAGRLIATERLSGIAVLDTEGRPVEVLSATDLLRAVIPGPVQDDPSLAGVMDEASADRLCSDGLGHKRVADLMRPRQHRIQLAAVDPDATVVECAATMARLRSPAVVVIEDGRLLGVLTASHLLEVLLHRSGS
jgi:CBS domain-containing protein